MAEETTMEKFTREKAEREAAEKANAEGAGAKGHVLGDEENPSDAQKPKVDVEARLKRDGSKSPHDASSDGGSRQAAAHKQVTEGTAGEAGKIKPGEVVVDKGLQPATGKPLSPSPIGAEDRNETGQRITPTATQSDQASSYTGRDHE